MIETPIPPGNVKYIEYLPTTGEILQIGSCDQVAFAYLLEHPQEGAAYLIYDGREPDLQNEIIRNTGEHIYPVTKPPMELSLSKDGKTILGCPTPCTAKIEDQVYEILDGSIELSFSHPGRYVVEITSRVTQPGRVTVNWHG